MRNSTTVIGKHLLSAIPNKVIMTLLLTVINMLFNRLLELIIQRVNFKITQIKKIKFRLCCSVVYVFEHSIYIPWTLVHGL